MWIKSHRTSREVNLAPEQVIVNATVCFSFHNLHIAACNGQGISVKKSMLSLPSSIPSCKNEHVLQSLLGIVSLLLEN